MRPRGLRGRLTLLVAIGATVVIFALTAGFNLILRSSLSGDADQVLRSRAESALETVAVGPGGEARLIEAPAAQDAGGGVWVYATGGRTLERPTAPAAVQERADAMAGSDGLFAEIQADDVKLFALAVRDDRGEQAGTVVSSLSLEPYERTVRQALIASAIFAGISLLGIVAISRLLVDRSLRPVARMTREATEWSESDLDHRFAAGEPHDELTELASAFDSMLDRLASSLRHEQRLSAEISHELRTPLAAIVAESELALTRGAGDSEDQRTLSRISERAGELQRILEILLAAARAEAEPGKSATTVGPVIERLLLGAEPLAQAYGVRLSLAEPFVADAVADVEEAMLERILSPVVENACRFAAALVAVRVDCEPGRVRIVIADDGTGVPPDEADRIFEPGVRGAESGSGGAGLGLSLSRRLAVAAGGALTLAVPLPGAGASFELELPAGLSR